MNMNVTTVEQAESLVNEGIDPSTADMAYIKNPRDGHYLLTATTPMSKSDLPCWSMGALWNVCLKREIGLEFITDVDSVEEVISVMVKAICNDVEEKTQNSLNFFKTNIK
jgi:hypothetical protein